MVWLPRASRRRRRVATTTTLRAPRRSVADGPPREGRSPRPSLSTRIDDRRRWRRPSVAALPRVKGHPRRSPHPHRPLPAHAQLPAAEPLAAAARAHRAQVTQRTNKPNERSKQKTTHGTAIVACCHRRCRGTQWLREGSGSGVGTRVVDSGGVRGTMRGVCPR